MSKIQKRLITKNTMHLTGLFRNLLNFDSSIHWETFVKENPKEYQSMLETIVYQYSNCLDLGNGINKNYGIIQLDNYYLSRSMIELNGPQCIDEMFGFRTLALSGQSSGPAQLSVNKITMPNKGAVLHLSGVKEIDEISVKNGIVLIGENCKHIGSVNADKVVSVHDDTCIDTINCEIFYGNPSCVAQLNESDRQIEYDD